MPQTEGQKERQRRKKAREQEEYRVYAEESFDRAQFWYDHACEEGIVFMAFDLESYESNHDIITEVGVSVLDLRKRPFFSTKHYRVKELPRTLN